MPSARSSTGVFHCRPSSRRQPARLSARGPPPSAPELSGSRRCSKGLGWSVVGGANRGETLRKAAQGRLDRLLNETAGLLATGNDVIRSVKEGAAQLVAQGNRAENRKEFLLQRAGAIFALKVASRTRFVRGRMR